MKTDDLVTLLATDATPPHRVWPGLALWMMLPVLTLGAGFLWAIGIRPDLATALVGQITLWKWLLPMMMLGAGMASAARLSRPEGRVGYAPLAAGLALLLAAGLVMWRLSVLPAADWRPAMMGKTHLICLSSIFGLGLPGLLLGLGILQRGATTRPAFCGLVAGLAVGGLAAALYATHCNEDDPLFFVTWYGLAILSLGALGAALGPRWLRW